MIRLTLGVVGTTEFPVGVVGKIKVRILLKECMKQFATLNLLHLQRT
jgi:hypothetical protein